MIKRQNAARARFPRAGDIVLYGGSTDTEGKVKEVPAMILGVQTPGEAESRVDLETIRIGLDLGIHSAVRYVQDPELGCWRWRPDRQTEVAPQTPETSAESNEAQAPLRFHRSRA